MRDAVTKLVGKLYHPINRPVHDHPKPAASSAVTACCSRASAPSLTTGKDASVSQRIFSMNRGLDPYVFTVSDVYQDITGEGTFTGKGLYHVDAFETAPEEAQDRREHGLEPTTCSKARWRCALVTDVELVEDFPTRYELKSRASIAGARGDWQLLPYISTRPAASRRSAALEDDRRACAAR